MARERSPNRDKAFELYKESNGEIQNREIANILGISEKTVSGWKTKDKWISKLNGVLQIKERSTPKEKKHNKKKKESIPQEVENGDLTKKQRLFCFYYIEDFNATRAYKRAYECDYETAMASGSRMLRNVKVKHEIDRLTEECLQEKEIDSKLISKRVLQKFMDIAFANINDFIEVEIRERERDDGSVVRWNNIIVYEEFDGSIVSEISQGKDGIKVKLADKMRALGFLAKYNNVLSADIREKLELERKKVEIAQSKVPSKEKADLQGQITALADLINNPIEERVLDDD
ncbi:terminase small subunit [Turicibacter sanguinis]|uniref:terminase small subunit n=1 Tax=Turicibacter sanguinis TaxID=154288 RepID=UPI0018AAE1DC|nr:terminase small subunit [Turicibacter sanguinis]MDB8553996.1 terminase small subunit [Turicibacter sanguinis]